MKQGFKQIRIAIYDTMFVIPEDYYHPAYKRLNCYPNVLPGKVCYSGGLEQRVQYVLLRWYFQPGYTFVDIGASCGVYSYLASRASCRVLGFEPIPELIELYRENVPDATCYEVALTDDLLVPLYIGNFTTHSTYASPEPHPERFSIQTARLDDYELKADIIKIDVEGMGNQVIAGGLETIKEAHVITVEIHNDQEFRYCQEILTGYGFIFEVLTESHIIAVRPPLKPPSFYESLN